MSAKLTIQHVATGLQVDFESYYFTSFADDISTSYNSVNTFGRMDPLMNYQGTTRSIKMSVRIDNSVDPASSAQNEAAKIHSAITKLQKMQYPVYERGANALTISQPPLVLVSCGNIIRGADGGQLLCAMDGFSFNPVVGDSAANAPMVKNAQAGSDKRIQAKDLIAFKGYDFSFGFTVLHQSPMGFSNNNPEISDQELVKDNITYTDQNMRFLGGYYFGSHMDARFDGDPVFFNSPAAGEQNNVNEEANQAEVEELISGNGN